MSVVRILPASAILCLFLVCTPRPFHPGGIPAQSLPARLAPDIEASYKASVLDAWFPRCIDTVYGGYRSTFDHAWNDSGPGNKMMTNQARHLFSASLAARRYPSDSVYRRAARTGYLWLRDKMWDSAYGGFFYNVSREGDVASLNNSELYAKDAYGHAFVIMALASYYALVRDSSVLALTVATFRWFDAKAHDPRHGGYFSRFGRDGSLLPDTADSITRVRWMRSAKDQNSILHILEGFNTLYRVWPDSVLRERILELTLLWRTKMCDPRGFTNLVFMPDWSMPPQRGRQPRSDTTTAGRLRDSLRTDSIARARGVRPDSVSAVRQGYWNDMRTNPGSIRCSFGHDLEFAYFALEALEVTGTRDSATEAFAAMVVDQALRWGWDREFGGILSDGTWLKGLDSCVVRPRSQTWWVEAEALHILLYMARHYQRRGYYDRFLDQWKHVRTYYIDMVNNGWYPEGINRNPAAAKGPKGYDWKASYHDGRAYYRCCEMLGAKDGWAFLDKK